MISAEAPSPTGRSSTGRDIGLDVLVFDFDGVLCRSVEVKTKAFAALYADQGPAVVKAVMAHHLAHGGISRDEKIRYFETVLLGHPADPAAMAAKAARFADLVVDKVIASPLLPGAAAFLAAYAGRLPLFVVSGTPEEELRRIVAAKGLDGFFRAVRGAPTGKAAHLAAILEETGARAEHTAMVGDALTDFAAAAAVGLRFVGVCDAEGGHPFPSGVPVVDDLTALADALAVAPVARTP